MKAYVYGILGASFGGLIGVIVKLIDAEIHYMTLTFYRVFFGLLFLLAVVPIIDRKAFKITKKDVGGYFFIGLILALSMATYTAAYFFTEVQNASLLGSMAPIFVLVLGYIVLKEKITHNKIIAVVVALIGLIIINPFNFDSMNSFGNILALVSAFFYSILIVGMRKEEETHSVGDVMWFFIFATLLLLPFPFIYGFGNIFDSRLFLLVIIIGVVATGMQYLFTNYSLRKIEAEVSSIITTVVSPLVAIVLAVIFINEQLNSRVIIGGIFLVAAGVYLETHNKQLKEEKEEIQEKRRRTLAKNK